MQLGVLPQPGGHPSVGADELRRVGPLVEAAGADSLWMVEHMVLPATHGSRYPYAPDGRLALDPRTPIPDPLDVLSFVAATTTQLELGTAMLILPQHDPVILAKRLATIDRLSGGRLIAGLGIGWLREEYAALGVPWEARGTRADEYLEAMQTLWRDSPATFHGRHVAFEGVHQHPEPVRRDGVRLAIGGHSDAAARRAARFGESFYPIGVDLDRLAQLRHLLDEEAPRHGRKPSEIALATHAPTDRPTLERLQELGVRRLILSRRFDSLDDIPRAVEGYRREFLDQ